MLFETQFGDVYRPDGSLVRRMRYEVDVTKTSPQTVRTFGEGSGEVWGCQWDQIRGRITDLSREEWAELHALTLTLHMEDGRTLQFELMDSRGRMHNCGFLRDEK